MFNEVLHFLTNSADINSIFADLPYDFSEPKVKINNTTSDYWYKPVSGITISGEHKDLWNFRGELGLNPSNPNLNSNALISLAILNLYPDLLSKLNLDLKNITYDISLFNVGTAVKETYFEWQIEKNKDNFTDYLYKVGLLNKYITADTREEKTAVLLLAVIQETKKLWDAQQQS